MRRAIIEYNQKIVDWGLDIEYIFFYSLREYPEFSSILVSWSDWERSDWARKVAIDPEVSEQWEAYLIIPQQTFEIFTDLSPITFVYRGAITQRDVFLEIYNYRRIKELNNEGSSSM